VAFGMIFRITAGFLNSFLKTDFKNPSLIFAVASVADPDSNPDPSDPYVFEPPGSGSFYHQAKTFFLFSFLLAS
jgi:hypothetical protein